MDARLPTSVAARAAGVSRATAYRWLGEDPRVLPSTRQNFAVTRPGSLSLREREEIGFQLARGQGVRQIAAVLGRAPSTISREVVRNRVYDRYVPPLAQEQTWARSRRPRPRKLDGLAIREQVVSMLTERFSPEQVAGRLRLEHPEDGEMPVFHETIYQALYVQGRGSLRLEVATALRSGRARSHPQKPDGPKAGRFQGIVMISDRPAEIEDRAVPGHWEGDLIIGSTSTRSAIGTLVERTSGSLMLLRLPGDHTAATVSSAMIKAMNTLPEQLRRSVTWDQGREMATHQEITMATGNTDLLLRPALALATRQQREHEWAAEAIFSEEHRPLLSRARDPRQRCRGTQRATTETPRLPHPRRSPHRVTLEPVKSSRCCDHHLNSPVSRRFGYETVSPRAVTKLQNQASG